MKSWRTFLLLVTTVLLGVTPLLTGCGTRETPAPEPPAQAATQAPPAASPVPPTPAPQAQGPMVGGTMVFALGGEPDTLDVHKGAMSVMEMIMSLVGATLVTRDPDSGEYVPYLAKSWAIADDGLTWDFVLRRDVKFHDGTPLTAQDYAWTFNRAIDPELKSPSTGAMLSMLESAEAIDEYTLRLNMKVPSFPLMTSLCDSYFVPYPRAAVEEMGDGFARQPIGVGPFRFKEWQTGDRIILERNPDYAWAPGFVKQGGPYLETIEFRIIPEYATRVAGLEAGDVDYTDLQTKDVARLRELGNFELLEYLLAGADPCLLFNLSKAPFDDLRVRQALNLAVNREALIKVVTLGEAEPQHGPITPPVAGYWPGVEQIGYGYDLERAKALMKEAGYATGAGGMLEKDGQPLRLTLHTGAGRADMIKTAEILQEQYKALGIEIDIVQKEWGQVLGDIFGGEFDFSVFSMHYLDFDIVALGFGSQAIGGMDLAKGSSPDLDALLQQSRTTMDPEARQEVCNEVQELFVKQALMGYLYAPKRFNGLNKRVKGVVFSPVTLQLWLTEAYIEP